MIPGWEKSIGAKDEHDFAREKTTVTIHYFNKNQLL